MKMKLKKLIEDNEIMQMKQWGLAKQMKTQEIEWASNVMSHVLYFIISLFLILYSLWNSKKKIIIGGGKV